VSIQRLVDRRSAKIAESPRLHRRFLGFLGSSAGTPDL
jgi:hypothetical protein